jgi:hypothetical protein
MWPMARLRRLGFAVNAADIGRSARPIRTGTRLEYSAESAPDRATAADEGRPGAGKRWLFGSVLQTRREDEARCWWARVTAVSDTAYGRR